MILGRYKIGSLKKGNRKEGNMLRIGITGAHGLGKTTLAKALAKEFNLYYLPEVAREMLGWSPDKDWRDFNTYQAIYFEEALMNAHKFYLNSCIRKDIAFVTDRIMLDIKAYAVYHANRGVIEWDKISRFSCPSEYFGLFTHLIFVFDANEDRTDYAGIEIQEFIEKELKNFTLSEQGNKRTFKGGHALFYAEIPAYPDAHKIIKWIRETSNDFQLDNLLNSDTDLAAFVKLYKKFGIDVKINKGVDDMYDIFLTMSNQLPVLKYREAFPTLSNKFGGRPEFYSRIVFDKDGKFVKQEFWG